MTDYADLALQVRSRMELGGDWSRYQPCDQQLKVSCNPNLIPQLSPDVQFGVQVAGTLLDRVQVDVDFDQAREFDAANRINIFYQGAEDDILRRLEVGDVTFNLPTSRFLTEGIPAGNFGFQAEGQLGPLDFQTVWAQQRGDLNSREFHLTGFGDQRAFVQEDTLVQDDADYARGQFFFLVDPRRIDRYPHIDALALDPASASPDVAPGPDPIQVYRFEDDPVLRQQVEGFIQADAVAKDAVGDSVKESGWFRYLQPGVDYYVHPSGLWIALRRPLSNQEMLAVTYITATGDTVGDYNPERLHNAGIRPTLKLLKASGANHQPGRPTWDQEMHQVYRVSGSNDVEPGSVDLTISLGELSAGRTFKRGPSGDDITFLRLFGVDEESPLDELDPAFVFSPGRDSFLDQPPVQGTFVVFPTLRPFLAPPPLPSLDLTAEEAAAVLAGDANSRIYEEEDPYERDAAGLFRLTFSYRIRSEGVISSFSLGALGIRDGSERIWLGDRLLQRGVDYQIDYDLGQVTLVDAEQLFTTNPDAAVRATWEQRSLFQVSPTQVFGLRTHAALGSSGGVDLLTLYRSERTVVTRPQLGTEPGAALMGGVGGNVSTQVEWFDRLLDRLPGLRLDGSTSLSVDGELAVSLPNPNTRGYAFVDDFDAAAELPVSLLSSDWSLGSAPSSQDGVQGILPPVLDPTNTVPLVWQHKWIVEAPEGDSVGIHEGYFPQELDKKINVVGSEVREPGLLVSLAPTPIDRAVWRSFMTGLSTTGLDLTKTDFLEFYVAGGQSGTLVVDLGSVSEDAFFVDSLGNTSGVRADDGRPWGLGVLDQEADPALGEIWSRATDEEGEWVERCRAEPGRIYRAGDTRANCTAGNGRRDSEDLDGDGNLDTAERHLRYVVRLDGTSPYLARTRAETGTEFQLYRIPIRGADAIEVGGVITDADLRAVKQLRITVAGQRPQRLQIARMRLVGSRWLKRAGEGLLRGLGGDTLSGVGRLEVGSVSKVTEGDAYVSPPRRRGAARRPDHRVRRAGDRDQREVAGPHLRRRRPGGACGGIPALPAASTELPDLPSAAPVGGAAPGGLRARAAALLLLQGRHRRGELLPLPHAPRPAGEPRGARARRVRLAAGGGGGLPGVVRPAPARGGASPAGAPGTGGSAHHRVVRRLDVRGRAQGPGARARPGARPRAFHGRVERGGRSPVRRGLGRRAAPGTTPAGRRDGDLARGRAGRGGRGLRAAVVHRPRGSLPSAARRSHVPERPCALAQLDAAPGPLGPVRLGRSRCP